MTAQILRLTRPPRIARCIGCRGHFRQRPTDELCSECFWWHKALTHAALATAALEKLGDRR